MRFTPKKLINFENKVCDYFNKKKNKIPNSSI